MIQFTKDQNQIINQVITLQTQNTSYQMKIDSYKRLLHLYYGDRIEGEDTSYRIALCDRGFSPNPWEAGNDRTYSLDFLPQEYSSCGVGDFRIPSIEVKNGDGSIAFSGIVTGYEVHSGKYEIPGMPSVWAAPGEHADTLQIFLEDPVTGIHVTLYYGVIEEKDVITRMVSVENKGDKTAYLEKIMSMTLDLLDSQYDVIHFDGRHAMERGFHRLTLPCGIHQIGSVRGASSHQHNPFAIVCDPDTTETAGECYGFSFVYSGNFLWEAEKDQYDTVRVNMGIHPQGFSWKLEPGECFFTPEVVMTFSGAGLEVISHRYHNLYRENLCKSAWVNRYRSVLINSWEAAYFDFTEDTLLNMAEAAVDMGVELFVLDDGWFGKRNHDSAALGDWDVNPEKIPDGICGLAKKINEKGLLFGLWVEPEMISEDSDLFRAHPDWHIHVPGRKETRGRYQYVLDFSRQEICDYIIHKMNDILDNAPISYIKWDMNRNITDAYSIALDSSRQGEVFHRYMLGVYYVLDNIVGTHPDVLFEGCSGGGGRFDPAMLYYHPQIWCSDNTDAVCRLKIQYGTSFAYPVSAMGAHVSVCPNHQTFRMTPQHTRAVTAMSGTFGFELDPGRLTEEEKALCRKEVQQFKKYYDVIQNGAYYRLSSPYDEGACTAWEHVSKDQTVALLSIVVTEKEGNAVQRYVRPRGLAPKQYYYVSNIEGCYSGQTLMKAGLPVPGNLNQYEAFQYEIIAR